MDAATRWNHTGYVLEKGRRYEFIVPSAQTWRDWQIVCGPGGYARWYLAPFTQLLRVTRASNGKARFFTLIGAIDESTDHAFVIGNGCTYIAAGGGELVCFANDVPWGYCNNKGTISFSVERLI